MAFTVLVPDTFPDTLPTTSAEVPSGASFATYPVRGAIPDELLDAEALVVWGNGTRSLEDAALRLPRLRWVQTLAAGPDALLTAGFAPQVQLTSGRGLHDGPVAEHTLALTLAAMRRLDLLGAAQREHRWAGELGGVQPVRPSGALRSLDGARVLIWGFGSIAARLAPLYRALGATVTGVATTAGERHGFPVIATEGLAGALPGTDLLVMILPDLPSTRGSLDSERISLLPPHAWIVNVGRGATVDEDALLDALTSGRVAGAALDVFATEPLPADSPLWDAPNTILSPHAAGGRPIGATGLVLDNLARLLDGRELRNLVPR